VPHNFLYQLFISAVVLILFARINESKGYLEVLVPGLIALVTASTAMQGLGGTMSVMRTYGFWRTVRGSPISTPMYLGGMVFSNMIRIYLTVGFMLVTARLVLDYHLRGSLVFIFLYVALGVAVFGALGLVVNYLVKGPQAVAGVLNVIFLLMMFSSNTLFIASLPLFKSLSLVSPLTFLTQLLRDNAQGAGLQSGWYLNMGALMACLIVLSAAALKLAQKRVEEA